MKRMMTIDLLMMLLAWDLFLNHYVFASIVTGALASLLVFIVIKEKFNYWRFLTVFFFGVMVAYFVITFSTLYYFFHGLNIFVITVILNSACLSEMLTVVKYKHIFPFLVIGLITFSIFLALCFFIPSDEYSLFTLTNIFILICLIFVPHVSIMLIHILIKDIKSVNHKKDKLIITKVSS